jgi:hypothetical protein
MKNFFLSFLFFIVFSVLGIAVGFGIGHLVTALNNEGLFTSWKQLDSSPKFKQIEDVSSEMVWAKAEDGKLYSWKFYCSRDPSCQQWVEVKELSNDTNYAYGQLIKKSDSCQNQSFRFYTKPPGNTIDCLQVEFAGIETGTSVHFALLDDGTMWAWQFTGTMIVDIFLTIWFSIGGLILGIIIFIVFMIRQARKNIGSKQ